MTNGGRKLWKTFIFLATPVVLPVGEVNLNPDKSKIPGETFLFFARTFCNHIVAMHLLFLCQSANASSSKTLTTISITLLVSMSSCYRINLTKSSKRTCVLNNYHYLDRLSSQVISLYLRNAHLTQLKVLSLLSHSTISLSIYLIRPGLCTVL